MTSKYSCPSCGHEKCVFKSVTGSTGAGMVCLNCFRTWSSMSDYEVSVVMAEGEEALPDDTYIRDGGLQNDLNELVRKSKVDVIELIRSQLPIVDWDKDGEINVETLDLYLKRMAEDIKDRRL